MEYNVAQLLKEGMGYMREYDVEEYIDDIRDICREAQEDPNNFGKQNYALEDNQQALLYMLLKGDRFSNGVFTLLYDDDYLVAFAGAYELNKIEMVGHYAIRIYWQDNHNSGIYTFELLQKIENDK